MLIEVYRLLTPKGRLQMLGLFLCSVTGAVFEVVGVGSIMPVMAVAAEPSTLRTVPLLQKVYAAGGFGGTQSFLAVWAAVVLASLCAVNALNSLTTYLACKFGLEQQTRISSELYAAYLARSFQWHGERHSVALCHSLERMRFFPDCVILPAINLLVRGVTCTALLLLLLWVDPVITLVGGGTLIACYTAIYSFSRRRIRRLAEDEEASRQANDIHLADSFGALAQIQLRGHQGYFAELHRAGLQRIGLLQASRVLHTEIPRVAIHVLANAAVLFLILYLHATLTVRGLLVPVVSVFALAGYRLLPSLQQCLACALTLESSRTIMDGIVENLPPGLQEPAGPNVATLTPRTSIELRDVSFAYALAREPVIQHCSLLIPAGSKVGIVGRTGLGKTTLLHLLMGLVPPTAGELLIDGLSPADVRAWHRGIGYVPQEIFLADTTLAGNIAFGEADVDMARVREAARVAGVEEFVGVLPHGYQTGVGERGAKLSGGQRQRIGLARALYHDPPALFLDEATSALDSGTEAELMHRLLEVARDKTVVIVAHRLSTVQGCDRILVVGRGGVVASGTYSELEEQSEEFRAIAPGGRANKEAHR